VRRSSEKTIGEERRYAYEETAMKCQDCGAENPGNAKYCLSCGRPIAVVTSEHGVYGGQQRSCVSCGRSIGWDTVFCPYCGRDYRLPAVPGTVGAEPTKKSGIPVAGGILTIIGGVLSFIMFLIVLFVSTDPYYHGLSDFGWVTLILTFSCAIVAFVGGAAAIIRKYYPLALLGAICSLAGFVVFGIPAIILIAISHKHFS